jgi:3-oxoacyl-[acyl-carrier-protein] synthase II
MKRRVVVTGLGWVTPHGDQLEPAFNALLSGQSAVKAFQHADFDATVPVASAAFDVSRWFTKLQLPGVDRVSQIAVAAAEMAKADAQLDAFPELTGIYHGTGMGGATALDDGFRTYTKSGRVHPLTVPAMMNNAGAGHIAIRFGIRGPVLTYSVACSSSGAAIAEAYKAIAYGDLDCVLAVGAEAILTPSSLRTWQALQTLATAPADALASACKPFSSERNGLVLGEGATCLILESAEHAAARGARVYAELAGYGMSCDAQHITKPDASGQALALNMMLRSTGLKPSEIGYCNAHGTATKIGDPVECEALQRAWGDSIGDLQVSSTKALHGHLLGGAGALEAAITVLAVHRRALPPNMHCEQPDPACNIRLVSAKETAAPNLQAAMSNSFAFGGTNVVLAFKRA